MPQPEIVFLVNTKSSMKN